MNATLKLFATFSTALSLALLFLAFTLSLSLLLTLSPSLSVVLLVVFASFNTLQRVLNEFFVLLYGFLGFWDFTRFFAASKVVA